MPFLFILTTTCLAMELILEVVFMEKKPNRLINEKSPYLLQHAYNPIDWYTWSEEAFEKARREDKPVFLSIGYAVCLWCHVHESNTFVQDSQGELYTGNDENE